VCPAWSLCASPTESLHQTLQSHAGVRPGLRSDGLSGTRPAHTFAAVAANQPVGASRPPSPPLPSSFPPTDLTRPPQLPCSLHSFPATLTSNGPCTAVSSRINVEGAFSPRPSPTTVMEASCATPRTALGRWAPHSALWLRSWMLRGMACTPTDATSVLQYRSNCTRASRSTV
jgi:hypothetical protein